MDLISFISKSSLYPCGCCPCGCWSAPAAVRRTSRGLRPLAPRRRRLVRAGAHKAANRGASSSVGPRVARDPIFWVPERRFRRSLLLDDALRREGRRKIGRTFLFQVEQVNAASRLALFLSGPRKTTVGKALG